MDHLYYGVIHLNEYERCFKLGLLRKVPPSSKKGKDSIKKASEWLNEAGKNKKATANDSCIASSYLAMFHAARAILFRDGVREKSHYCIARYLEKYVEEQRIEEEWVVLLDRLRDIRHNDQYSLTHQATIEEASAALDAAKDFVSRIKKLFTELENK